MTQETLKIQYQTLYLFMGTCMHINSILVCTKCLGNVYVCWRTLTTHDASSHVLQYRDLNMNKDGLLIYFDAHHANCNNDNTTYTISIKFTHLISIVLVVLTLDII